MAAPWIKICGLTRVEDARLALDLGARYVGCVLVPSSPRCASVSQTRRLVALAGLRLVTVVRDLPVQELEKLVLTVRPGVLQLHGQEPPAVIRSLQAARPELVLWKVLAVPPKVGDLAAEVERLLALAYVYEEAGAAAILLDTQGPSGAGGTGQTGDWRVVTELARSLDMPLILAGGLGPENVEAAATQVQPAGLDISSGVEEAPGKKSADRLRALFAVCARLYPERNA